MSTDATPADDAARHPTTGVDAATYERYAAVETDGDVIIYDRDCEDAWIQSARWLTVEEYR